MIPGTSKTFYKMLNSAIYEFFAIFMFELAPILA